MIKFISIFSLLTLTLFGSCSKKEAHEDVVYTLVEFDTIMGTTSATLDKNTANAIKFSDYSKGVSRANSKAMIYENLSFSVLEFESEKEARDEAVRLNQYYSRNWLFDKVEGEPILEDFVILKFNAINPNRKIQRIPKNK